jgi:hypothetical protein
MAAYLRQRISMKMERLTPPPLNQFQLGSSSQKGWFASALACFSLPSSPVGDI